MEMDRLCYCRWPASTLLFLGATAFGVGCGGGGSGGSVGLDPEIPNDEDSVLIQYESWADLESDLKSLMIAEMMTRGGWHEGGGWRGPGFDDGTDAGAGSPGGDAGGSGDFSRTNNQEPGVDEADYIKTDGSHHYVLNGNRLHIFAVPSFGELEPVSVTPIEGYPQTMLVDEERSRLVVFSSINPGLLPEEHPLYPQLREEDGSSWYFRTFQVTKLTVLDASDVSQPILEQEIFLEGGYQTARLADGLVRLVSYAYMSFPYVDPWYGWDGTETSLEERRALMEKSIRALSLDDLLPAIHERSPSGDWVAYPRFRAVASDFFRPEDSHGRGMTTLLSLDLREQDVSFTTKSVVTNLPTVYATATNTYIAEAAHDLWWLWNQEDSEEELNIHKFEAHEGENVYRGSGRVPGLLQSQFAMSEYEGHLRLATTHNGWNFGGQAPEPATNHVYVMANEDDKLVVKGHIPDMAPGEQIFAARFQDDRGFLVTFQQIDPLFTMDLSDPENPRVVGELEIPGFSTYIHPIAADRLLTIGVGGDETGVDWKAQVSLFDVSQFDSPRLADVESLNQDGQWAWSEAQYQHHAFRYWETKQMLAVPVSLDRWNDEEQRFDYMSHLQLVSVDPQAGLQRHGQIDHSTFYEDDAAYWVSRAIRRSIFMGDTIYGFSERGISVHDLETLERLDEAALPGYDWGDQYWWW